MNFDSADERYNDSPSFAPCQSASVRGVTTSSSNESADDDFRELYKLLTTSNDKEIDKVKMYIDKIGKSPFYSGCLGFLKKDFPQYFIDETKPESSDVQPSQTQSSQGNVSVSKITSSSSYAYNYGQPAEAKSDYIDPSDLFL